MSEPTLDEMNTVVAEYLQLWKRGEKHGDGWLTHGPNGELVALEPHEIPPPSLLTDWSAFGAAWMAAHRMNLVTRFSDNSWVDTANGEFYCMATKRSDGEGESTDPTDPRIAFVRAVFKLATREKP